MPWYGYAKQPNRWDCGYFIRQGWHEYPETIAVMALGEQTPIPNEREVRENLVKLIQPAKQLDLRAAAHMRKALELL